jgi:beta-glucosidase
VKLCLLKHSELVSKWDSVVRPVKELKGFERIKLNTGETKTVKSIIDNQLLSFYNDNLEYKSEPVDFDLMIGSTSEDIRVEGTFELLKWNYIVIKKYT